MNKQSFTPRLSAKEFNEIVVAALESLPADIQQMLNNVEVTVQDWPTMAELQSVGLRSRYQLLGLYHGIPLTARTTHYGLVLPDKITIFRMPIEYRCRTPEAVTTQIQRTVIHELAHHFGISDDRLRELGAY